MNLDLRDWKRPDFDGLIPSVVDWAKMAAFIDGEGSVLINPRGAGGGHASLASRFYLKLTVANTDVRLPVWCKQTFGGTYKDANTAKYYGEHKNFKTAWHWSASSTRAAWILFNCLPYFTLKAEQAEIGIALQESMNAHSKGRTLSDETVEHRRSLKKRLLVLKARGKKISPEQQERIEEVS